MILYFIVRYQSIVAPGAPQEALVFDKTKSCFKKTIDLAIKQICKAIQTPAWLYEGETYADLTRAEQIEPYKAFPFIDWGQPAPNVKWVEEFHELNIRVPADSGRVYILT